MWPVGLAGWKYLRVCGEEGDDHITITTPERGVFEVWMFDVGLQFLWFEPGGKVLNLVR